MVANINTQTALMVEAFDDSKLIVQSKGFQTFFAKSDPVGTFVTNSSSINYDIRRKGKKISELLTRKDAARSLGTNSKVHTGSKFENVSNVFPNITESISADWNTTLDRHFGEGPYGTAERLQRMQMELIDNGTEAMGMMAGRLELQCAETLTTAKTTLDDAASSQYNFGRAAANTFAATALWTVATHDPRIDLDLLDTEIRQNGKTAADFVVMSEDSWSAFQANAIIKALADVRNYDVIKVGDLNSAYSTRPNVAWMSEAGFVLQAKVRTPNGREFPVFTYPEQYQDASNVWQDYMPAKSVFMGDSTARLKRFYGPSITMPASATETRMWMEKLGIDYQGTMPMPEGVMDVLDPRMFNFDFDVPTGAQTGALIRASINPLFIPTHVDAFGLITATVA